MKKKDTMNRIPSDHNYISSAWNEFTLMSNEELKAYQEMLKFTRERQLNENR